MEVIEGMEWLNPPPRRRLSIEEMITMMDDVYHELLAQGWREE